jgi:uncharacterized membrane protein YphA (DoxX/SURF4 family)
MMDLALWVLQVALAVGFLGAGYMHAFRFERFSANPRMAWALSVGRENMRIIGLLEIAGAVGLVLPAAIGIAPGLSVVAAGCLALLMGAAIVFHLRRGEPVVSNLLLGGLAVVVVVGRVFVAPF